MTFCVPVGLNLYDELLNENLSADTTVSSDSNTINSYLEAEQVFDPTTEQQITYQESSRQQSSSVTANSAATDSNLQASNESEGEAANYNENYENESNYNDVSNGENESQVADDSSTEGDENNEFKYYEDENPDVMACNSSNSNVDDIIQYTTKDEYKHDVANYLTIDGTQGFSGHYKWPVNYHKQPLNSEILLYKDVTKDKNPTTFGTNINCGNFRRDIYPGILLTANKTSNNRDSIVNVIDAQDNAKSKISLVSKDNQKSFPGVTVDSSKSVTLDSAHLNNYINYLKDTWKKLYLRKKKIK